MQGLTVTLDLAGRRGLLVGGGAVAARKARALLQAGLQLVVVAPALDARLAELAAQGQLEWRERAYHAADLDGAAVVVVASDCREVNRQVAADAGRLGLLVNVADAPQEGNCRFPALLQCGDLQVAVSTGGRVPGMAAAVRDLLAEQLDEAYGQALELLAEQREKQLTLQGSATYNASFIKGLFADGLPELLRRGERAQAEELIERSLRAVPTDLPA